VYGNARLSGNARLFGNAQLFGDAQLSGNAQLFGNARLFGNAQLSGNARLFGDAQLSGNAWTTSPLYIQGTKHSITNCAYGQLVIGCQVHTFAEWKDQYKAIGKAAGYTAEQIKEYGLHIAHATKVGK
jgi:hypothetical protein